MEFPLRTSCTLQNDQKKKFLREFKIVFYVKNAGGGLSRYHVREVDSKEMPPKVVIFMAWSVFYAVLL